MRLFPLLVALALAGCNACQQVNNSVDPPPSGTASPPRADAGPACAHECAAAVAECAHPVASESACEATCADGLKFTRNSARCIARTFVCNAKDSCP